MAENLERRGDLTETRRLKKRQRSREWYLANRDQILARQNARHHEKKSDPVYLAKRRESRQKRKRAHRIYQQKYYVQNREHILERTAQWQKANRQRANAKRRDAPSQYKNRKQWLRWLKDVPCADCGARYPHYVMDFDHARGVKRCNVPKLLTAAVPALLAEVEKCDVVCANCHRERTHVRRLAKEAR